MTISFPRCTEMVAGGRLTSSAQPPHAPLFFTPCLSSPHTPQPFPPASFLKTPSALREGLRCFTAFRPLPLHFFKEAKEHSGSN